MNTLFLNGSYQNMVGKMLYCWFAMGHKPNEIPFENERFATVDEFIEQVQWADSIYFEGGETFLLLQRLKQCGNWLPYLKDKTIVAVSAGISALATASFNIDYNVIVQGTGVLPFTTIVHYNKNMEWMVGMLKKKYPDLPVVVIPDGKYITLYL